MKKGRQEGEEKGMGKVGPPDATGWRSYGEN